MESFWLLIKFLIAAIIMAAIVIFMYGYLADMATQSGAARKLEEPKSGLLEPPKKPSW
jgi:uncharacterized membrane protein